jgi:D-glycero-D-manno-heptose 1,7-bisphosphate phosphatase
VAAFADICIRVPSTDTQRIQEACVHLGHSLCELVEARMCGTAPALTHTRSGLSLTTAFLDRDGTLNRKASGDGYVTSPEALQLLPGAGQAVRRLNDAGVCVVVVTNQRCVHRGLLDEAGLSAIHDRLRSALAAHHARVDAIYACTHALDGCRCRKPWPGLLIDASRQLPGIDLARAVTVGDAETDVAAGIAAGTATVRLAGTGATSAADVVLPDLTAAVDWILRQ